VGSVNALFNEYDCSILHAQHRYSTGHAGRAQPLTSMAPLSATGTQLAPLLFRAELLIHLAESLEDEEAVNRALVRAAGLEAIRFSDHVLTVVNRDPV
jgi:hypothetical protein